MDEVLAAITRAKSRLMDVAAEFPMQPDSVKFAKVSGIGRSKAPSKYSGFRSRAAAVGQATHFGM